VIQFAIGNCFVVPVGGNLPTNPTPTIIPIIQDASVDMSGEVKELYGQYRAPVDTAPGNLKCSGKFTIGSTKLLSENNMIWADSLIAGIQAVPNLAGGDTQAISATVTAAHTTGFVDLGVVFGGINLTRVSASPAQGQYSVVASTGVYTFNAADVTLAGNVNLYYQYTPGTVIGQTLTIHNQIMGYGPVVSLYISESYQVASGVASGIYLPACRFTGIKNAMKRDDYLKPELDFAFYADPTTGIVAQKFQAVLTN
jgi:hypothetical protein